MWIGDVCPLIISGWRDVMTASVLDVYRELAALLQRLKTDEIK
jgi:hypothetical protein